MDAMKTMEQLVEAHEDVYPFELIKGVLVGDNRIKKGVMIEFTGKDQREIAKDRRGDVDKAFIAFTRCVYLEEEDGRYRNITFKELDDMRAKDQNILSTMMANINGADGAASDFFTKQ